jgi:formamidopyrimidine-DNA glycosylase
MPELPDVEGFRRVLKTSALRKTIEHVIVSDTRILGDLAVRTFVTRLQGAKLIEARRQALDGTCRSRLSYCGPQ